MIGIKGFVCKQSTECEPFDQVRHPDNFAALPGQQFEPDKVAKRVGEGKNLGGQTAFGAANGLIESPPFAPLAFW